MEPKYSMTAYAIAISASVIGLGLRGFPLSALGLALGVALWGLSLYALYRLSARAAARRLKGRRRLSHRIALDRVVLGQLAAITVVGVATVLVCETGDFAPAADSSVILQAFVLGAAVIATTVYLSALIDWFWVLPKISGLTREPPCVRPGGQRWEGVTGVWLAHRAIATIIVTVVLAAIPGWLAAKSGRGGTESAAWVVLGTVLGIGFNSISGNSLIALRQAWNPRIRVGDTVLLRPKLTDELKRAFVIDVSVQGFKYRVPADQIGEPAFHGKGKQVPAQVAAEMDPEDDEASAAAICPSLEECRAIYWYCCRNAEAHGRSDDESSVPVPLA
jgi:hypothetical protein